MSVWTPKEEYVELNIVDEAWADGWWCEKIEFVGKRGAPDRVFAKRGRVVWIEFKRPAVGNAKLHQQRRHQEMREAGLEVYVCNDLTLGRSILGLPYRPGMPT